MLNRRNNLPENVTIELRFRLPLVWLAVCLVAAFLLPDRIWNTLLIGVGGLFLVSYLWARQMAQGVSATRRMRFGWVAVGDLLEEMFTLRNWSPLPALWVEIIDEANVPGYRAATVRGVSERSEVRWRETAVCQQRGQYQLGPWRLRTSDPFGIFMVTINYPVAGEIVIHPPIHSNIPIPLPTGARSGRTRAQQRAQLATLNAASLRGYQPSDPMRWIHWPTTARRNELFVKTFDLDTAGAIWLCLDLRQTVQLGEGMEGTEEHAVVLAAALTAQALRQNRPIGLAAYGKTPLVIPPAQGNEQRWRILRALALVRADADVSLSKMLIDLKRLARRGTAVSLITPDPNTEWIPHFAALRQSGVKLYATLLDRPSFDGKSKMDAVRESLYRINATVHIVQRGELGQAPEQIANNQDFIVTKTGKVVQRGDEL